MSRLRVHGFATPTDGCAQVERGAARMQRKSTSAGPRTDTQCTNRVSKSTNQEDS